MTDDKLYAYTLSTKARDEDKDIDLHSDNGEPRRHLVRRDDDVGVRLATTSSTPTPCPPGTATATRTSDLDSDNDLPRDIWSDGTTMWVADNEPIEKAYAYTLSNGDRDEDKDIDLTSANFDRSPACGPTATTMWVSGGQLAARHPWCGLRLSDGERDSSKDFNSSHLASIPVTGRTYLWGRGSTIWMSVDSADKIYAFHGDLASFSTDATLSSLTVDGAEVPGLDADRTEAYEFGVAHDVAQVTVAAVPNHSGASVAYSVTDADGWRPRAIRSTCRGAATR